MQVLDKVIVGSSSKIRPSQGSVGVSSQKYFSNKELCDMKIQRIDHVDIIVNDLPAAKAFFLGFGLEMLGEGEVDGEWWSGL